MNKRYPLLVSMLLLGFTACGGGGNSEILDDAVTPQFVPLNDPNLQLISTPADGHTPFVDAIKNAKTSVRLVMFHLQDPNVTQALIDAHNANVNVQVIVDRASLSDQSLEAVYQNLLDSGVDIMKSSTGFSITHEKAMVVDDQKALITAMNMSLPTQYNNERDFGVITQDASVIAEWNSVFSADVENSKQGTANTPELSVPSLLWSPISSGSKLTSLIDSAGTSIITTVENINYTNIIEALRNAAKRGVNVRLITPQCVAGSNPELDYPALKELSSNNVSVRIMPNPHTPTTPYMHSKMILVDNTVAYVGSINFTVSSITKAREAGIIFINQTATNTISSMFETDWSNAIAVTTTLPANYCPGN